MSKVIEYYFTSASPFAFMGHDALMDVAARHGCGVAFKPVNLAGVWEHSGAVMPAQRPPVRQRYRLIELQRIAEMRGIDLKHQPSHFPTNPTLADHCAVAMIASGGDVARFVRSVGEALWVKDLQIADEAVLGDLIKAAGSDPHGVLREAASEATARVRADNTQEAVEKDAIGAPAYVYNGEVFWGQDRIDLMERMIESGREAFPSS